MKCDFETYKYGITTDEIASYLNRKEEVENHLKSVKDWVGWRDLDKLKNKFLLDEIRNIAKEIRDNADVFLVIGIGGSYLGAQAVIDALSPYFYNNKNKSKIYFIGTSLSSDEMNDILEMIKDKSIYLNVISKSGTTTETASAYELVMSMMREKYTLEELKSRVIMTTNKNSGILKEEADKYDFRLFEIPDDIGGRYSVFTPVGLLPIAVLNFDLDELFRGAVDSNNLYDEAIKYAGIKDLMFRKNIFIESFVVYEPKLGFFGEWLKQLYGESLGKELKGLFPSMFINSRDLHSLGQFVQEGSKILFETVINVENCNNDLFIEKYDKSLNEINQITLKSVCEAHLNGNVMSNIISIPKLDEYNFGMLMQFFMISCEITAYFLGVDAFNQPGVEEYKNIVRENLKP